MVEISPGQAWICPPSDDVPPLMVIVGRIDDPRSICPGCGADPSRRVVSVTVTPHPSSIDAGWPTISHIPLDQESFGTAGETLACDGIKLGKSFDAGFRQWADAFARGECGVFRLAAADAYRAIVSLIDGSPLAAPGASSEPVSQCAGAAARQAGAAGPIPKNATPAAAPGSSPAR